MLVGLIDVDGHNYPNLCQMKLSAYHKERGDKVEIYNPFKLDRYDIVYMSKVFSFTNNYQYPVDAEKVIRGGTGYFYPDGGDTLPYEIEHAYPDYSLYGIDDTAYGFLTRGCPRGCNFCVVSQKEGRKSVKVADLNEFWKGQKHIELLDPNMFACKDWMMLSQQLIDSKARINFSQGCDIRIMTKEMAETIKQMKISRIHFAWDRYYDKDIVVPRLKMFKEITGWSRSKIIVYVLTNYDTTLEQDLDRIYTLREIGVDPDVRIYNKHLLPRCCIQKSLQRWVNKRNIWGKVPTFEEYLSKRWE